MSDSVYAQLADAFDRLPNRFLRTQSGIELEVLEAVCSPAEARVCAVLSEEPVSEADIARACGLTEDEVASPLAGAVGKRLARIVETASGEAGYRLVPFMVGWYEAQVDTLDHRLAHLVEEYFQQGGTAGIMSPGPSLLRVVPAEGSIKSEWILPYDQLKPLLEEARTFTLRDCICRKHRALLGNECRFPMRTCLIFSSVERPPDKDSISRKEALAVLDEAERLGLVHCVSNVSRGLNFVCNCCSCCCGILRGLVRLGIKDSVAVANYYAQVESDLCSACGLCTERCQVGAVAVIGSAAVVDREKCIGCGLCATTCPTGAVTMQLKPPDEIVDPPEDLRAWGAERQERRAKV